MSFTKVAPAGIGTEPGNSILIGDSLLHSTGIDIGNNTGIGVTIRKHGDATFTGIVTAASFSASGAISASSFTGDGSGLEGVSSSGIGTPLSDDDTSDLNKIYYVNQELSIGSTITVNHPSSAVASYTHYQDLVVTDDADFIVSDGDTFIPDVLGIRTSTSTTSAPTGGRIRAGTITNAAANGAPNFPNGLTGTTGTFTGNLNVGGVLTYEDVTNVDSIGVITARDGLRVTGIATATAFHGDGSALTGVGASFGNSSINTSGIITATAFVPTQGQLSHRNIIVNGAMTISQRGTSDSSTNGYGTVDRFGLIRSGVDENPVQTQHTLTSSDTGPYAEGFRKSFHVQNGNQTGGVGGNDYISMRYRVEAQDMANSGWNYTSSSSFITLSFWVKSSVAQNFYGYFYSHDGTAQNYAFETGSLTADTWTKVVLKIPGNSNLSFDNDTNEGLDIYISQFWGINRTDSGKNLNSWAAYNGAARMPDFASTWYTTNNATFEITGVQLEVGPVATPFEHRSFGEELTRCHRYFFNIQGANGWRTGILGYANSSSEFRGVVNFPAPMRANPTFTGSTTAMVFDSSDDSSSFNVNTISSSAANSNALYNRAYIEVSPGGMTAGQAGQLEFRASNGFMNFSAEL